MTSKTFEDFEIWQKARAYAQRIHVLINTEPFCHDYKLKDQINGSSGSIMDNIAEGFERDGNKEFIQFLSYAKGSAGESRSQLYRALDRKYLSIKDFEELKQDAVALSKMLSGFRNYLKQSERRGRKFMP